MNHNQSTTTRCQLTMSAILILGLLTGCATHRIEVLNTAPSYDPTKPTKVTIAQENRAPAYVNVRIFHGDLDEEEIYPTPKAVTKFGMFLAGQKRQTKTKVTPYINIPLESLKDLGFFSTVKDLIKSELPQPEEHTYFLIDYDIAHDLDFHWFRNDVLLNPYLGGMLFSWIPYREDLTMKIRVNVRRTDGETATYHASATVAVYYHNWSSADTKAAKENLRKTAINKSVTIFQRQMLDDGDFYRSNHTIDERKQAEQSHGEATQQSARSAAP